jgi:hypothetical protein
MVKKKQISFLFRNEHAVEKGCWYLLLVLLPSDCSQSMSGSRAYLVIAFMPYLVGWWLTGIPIRFATV